jgi:hypothetical protein
MDLGVLHVLRRPDFRLRPRVVHLLSRLGFRPLCMSILTDALKIGKRGRQKVPPCDSSHERTRHSSPCLNGRGLLARSVIKALQYRLLVSLSL